MSNFDRAVKALNDVDGAIGHLADNEAYVAALEAAGLLMPDLPNYTEADSEAAYWYEGTYAIGASRTAKKNTVRIMLWDSEPGGVLYTDTESARDYALKILAACEYAEQEQGNE